MYKRIVSKENMEIKTYENMFNFSRSNWNISEYKEEGYKRRYCYNSD